MRVKLFPNFTCHHLITHTYCYIQSSKKIYPGILPICPENVTEKNAICPENTLPKMLSELAEHYAALCPSS